MSSMTQSRPASLQSASAARTSCAVAPSRSSRSARRKTMTLAAVAPSARRAEPVDQTRPAQAFDDVGAVGLDAHEQPDVPRQDAVVDDGRKRDIGIEQYSAGV